MDENNMEQRIHEALDAAMPESSRFQTLEGDIFADLSKAKKHYRRYHVAVPALIIALLFLSTAAAYTAVHLTTVSEWLGIESGNAPGISTPIEGTDDVSFELTGLAYQDNTMILAIHAVPSREGILLYPSDRLATGLGLTAPVRYTIQGVPEPYGDLPLNEYISATEQDVCWTMLLLTGPDDRQLSNAKWVMQEDGSMMIFIEIVPVEMKTGDTLRFRTVTASMSDDQARSFSRSGLTAAMLQNGSRGELAVSAEQCLFADEPVYSTESYVQEATGIEFRNIAIWKTPAFLTVCYSYRLPEEIPDREQSVVTAGPSIMYKNAVSFISSEEMTDDGIWVVCRETIPTVSTPYNGKLIIMTNTGNGTVISELPWQMTAD
ncbi:MAG: hypothetical protein CW338_02570 [Clostridiales bacterium]|nr:hypothetical protein [Clostridiales bacterium]